MCAFSAYSGKDKFVFHMRESAYLLEYLFTRNTSRTPALLAGNMMVVIFRDIKETAVSFSLMEYGPNFYEKVESPVHGSKIDIFFRFFVYCLCGEGSVRS